MPLSFFVDVPRPSAAAALAAARSSVYRGSSPYSSDGEAFGEKGKGKGKGRGLRPWQSMEEENEAFLSGADWPPLNAVNNLEEDNAVLRNKDSDDGDEHEQNAALSSLLFGNDDDHHERLPRASTSKSAIDAMYGADTIVDDSGVGGGASLLFQPPRPFTNSRRTSRSASASSSVKSDMPLAHRTRLIRADDSQSQSRSTSPPAGYASKRRRPRRSQSRSQSRSRGTLIENHLETLDRLPMDVGVAKILARHLTDDGISEYVVRLDDGRRVKVRTDIRFSFCDSPNKQMMIVTLQVSADLISQFADLLADYEEAIESGLLDESGFLRDDDEEPMPAVNGKTRRSASATDLDYGIGASSSPEPDNADDMNIDKDEDEDDSGIEFLSKSTKPKKVPEEATRSSVREGARKDYSVNFVAEEERSSSPGPSMSESESESGSGSTGQDSDARRSRRVVVGRGMRSHAVVIGNDSDGDDDDDDDGPVVTSVRTKAKSGQKVPSGAMLMGGASDDDDEEKDELASADDEDGDKTAELEVEQMHTDVGRTFLDIVERRRLIYEKKKKQDCCTTRCKASRANILLVDLLRKKKNKKWKKRRKDDDDDDWDEDGIAGLGACVVAACRCRMQLMVPLDRSWIECGQCSYSFHWQCVRRPPSL